MGRSTGLKQETEQGGSGGGAGEGARAAALGEEVLGAALGRGGVKGGAGLEEELQPWEERSSCRGDDMTLGSRASALAAHRQGNYQRAKLQLQQLVTKLHGEHLMDLLAALETDLILSHLS